MCFEINFTQSHYYFFEQVTRGLNALIEKLVISNNICTFLSSPIIKGIILKGTNDIGFLKNLVF